MIRPDVAQIVRSAETCGSFTWLQDVKTLAAYVSELEEQVAVLEGDLADMKLVFASPWWNRGVV